MLINGYQVNGVKLQCKYVSGGWSPEGFSYCEFTNHGIFNGLRVKIDSVEMTNADGVSTNDVKALNIVSIPSLNYFPENLAVLFKNILGIQVHNSNLQEITINDLKSFVKLQYLYMQNNKITTIEEGLFSNNPDLKYIYLINNQISHIDPNVFDHLQNLNTLYLSNNKCKQSFGDATSRSDVFKFIERIKKGECSDEQIMQKKKEAQDQLIIAKQQADNESKTNITELENQLTTLQESNNNQTQLLNAANVKIKELQELHSTCEKLVDECNSEKQSCLQQINEVQSTCLMNLQPVNELNKKIKVLSDKLLEMHQKYENLLEKASGKLIEKIQGKNSDVNDDQTNDSNGEECLKLYFGPHQRPIILSN